MENDDIFGENPFRKLDPKAFPKRREPATNRAPTGRRDKYYSIHAGEPNISDEDRELFAKAMARLPIIEAKPVTWGVQLGNLCKLPDRGKKNRARKQRKEAVKPKEVAEDSPIKQAEPESEEFLWAMRNATPLARGGRRIAKTPKTASLPPIREPGMEDFMDGNLEFTLSHTDEYMSAHVAGMDELTLNQLAMGQYSPEAHLDLHGLNSTQAFETLRDFVRSCWFKGLRVGLVVTGRGRNSPDGHAVLRQKLQFWLTQEPFKRVVLAFCTAQAHDGGPGAIYVLFRKYRKKGRIYWERMPADADLF